MRRGTAVRVPAEVRRTMVEHARREQPRECCGLLVGAGDRITLAVPMRNLERGRTRYRVDPAAHIALQRVLRVIEPRLSIVGAYHSHPRGRAVPSETDIAEAMYPEWIYVIVGLGGRRRAIRAFAGCRGLPVLAIRPDRRRPSRPRGPIR